MDIQKQNNIQNTNRRMTYKNHVTTPLPITKVLEPQPLGQAESVFFCGSSRSQPP